jgi:hypothetical protein
MSSAADRVAREDLVMFINACFSCTGQREFYADARGQAVPIRFLHAYILGNYRLLYARSLASGMNHFNQAEVIVRLLETGRDAAPEHRAEEGALIAAALRALPTHRAYHVLRALAERRVNNRRARAIVREYLAGRSSLDFEAVKYRSSLRAAAIHAHLSFASLARRFSNASNASGLPGTSGALAASELGSFLFRGYHERRYKTPLFESFRQARFSQKAIYELPYTIAEGLAEARGVRRAVFLARIEPRLTGAERLRLQDASARVRKESVGVDLAKAPLTKLASYALSLSKDDRRARKDELTAALSASAARAVRRAGVRYGRVAAVLDASYSASGSTEKRRRPLAVALGANCFLRAASEAYRAFWTRKVDDELLVSPRGATDLATPLLDALDWGAGTIVIVSDGFENDPPGGAAEVLRVYSSKLARGGGPFIVHMNPVFDTESYAPRPISDVIPTMGVRDAEDIPTMLGFARFAAGACALSELLVYLDRRVRRLLHAR